MVLIRKMQPSLTDLSIDRLECILTRLDVPTIYEVVQLHTKLLYAYNQMQFHILYNHLVSIGRTKTEILEFFVKFYSRLDEQGTDKWKNIRGTGVGGSEMATVNNNNPHSNWRELIGRKLYLPVYAFSGNVMTQWGNIFEPMLQLYMELMMHTKIYETGRIPGVIRDKHRKRIQGYSPDGVAIVKKSDFKYMIDSSAEDHGLDKPSRAKEFKKLPDEITLLYEFKNPYIRVPKGVIKDHYIDQPKAGMCTIPMTEACIFVDGVFRKCSIDQFGFSPYYDVKFHCKPRKIKEEDVYIRKLKYDKPISCGFIGVMDMGKPFDDEEWESDDNEWNVEDSSSYESSAETESFEEEERLQLSKELKVTIAKSIIKRAKAEVTAPKSDYYELQFVFENALRIIKLVAELLDNVLNAHYDEFGVDLKTQVDIIYVIIKRLFPKNHPADQLSTIKMLIPGTLDILYDDCASDYDLSDLNYGTDYGDTRECPIEEFDDLAEKIVGDRFRSDGYKCYYPEKFFYDPESKMASKLDNPINGVGNYIDRTLELDLAAKKWLFQNVEEFLEHCKQNNVRPVGIIPWKLYEVCCMPSYKDPDYLTKCKPEIVR